jgi:hypothetical protein
MAGKNTQNDRANFSRRHVENQSKLTQILSSRAHSEIQDKCLLTCKVHCYQVGINTVASRRYGYFDQTTAPGLKQITRLHLRREIMYAFGPYNVEASAISCTSLHVKTLK